MEQFTQYFDVVYLIIIVLGGKILTDPNFIMKNPLWLRTIVDKLGAAWVILIFSFIVGVGLHYFDGQVEVKKLISTFLLANSLYALIVKYVFEYIQSLLPGAGKNS